MPEYDARQRDRLPEATRLAAEVREFAAYPQTKVLVLTRDTPEWRRYQELAEQAFAATDQPFEAAAKGLGGSAAQKERSPVWQARNAALKVFNGPAQHAVVAALGDSSLFTVAGIERKGSEFRIVGAGSTHPTIGADGNHGVPPAARFGAAAWYAVNHLAAKESRAVVEATPSATWRVPAPEPISLDQPIIMRLNTAAAQTPWNALEVEDLAASTRSRLPEERNPFEALDQPLDRSTNYRDWAIDIRRVLDSGQTTTVLSADDQGAVDPDRGQSPPGLRAVMVNDPSGTPQITGMVGRAADGRVVVRDVEGASRDARTTLILVGMREAEALGVGLDFQGDTPYRTSAKLDELIDDVKDVLGPRMDEIPGLGWENAGTPGAAPAEVAAAVTRFSDAGGDVLQFTPDDPRFAALRGQVADRLTAALQVPMDDDALRRLDGADAAGREVDPELAALWQAMNPSTGTATETGIPGAEPAYAEGTQVAVAIDRDGTPLAAATFRKTDERIELGAAGGQADAVRAAIVDGPFRQFDKPAGAFVGADVAETYRQAGARIGGTPALDAEWLTNVEVRPDEASRLYYAADRARNGQTPEQLNDLNRQLTRAQAAGTEIVVLDHSDPSARNRAEQLAARMPGCVGAVEGPRDDAHRATIAVVQGGQVSAWATVDTTPDRPIELAELSKGMTGEQAAPVDWWMSNHQERLDREVRYSEPLVRAMYGANADPSRFVWNADSSKYRVDGIHHRSGDSFDAMVAQAGSETPGRSADSQPQQQAAQGEAAQGQRPDTHRGPGTRGPDRGTGR
ncbi:hypothetical protein HPO96_21330 [Kribbella sandramycini]|uniref:Uncharacterized protein n=1 Tax=Kribbella sandramycini TaxID=60450 RepID=A0A7Y4L3K7_9ACTN|nr:hypothetical protein [Kribbella sandramycini]MBB6566552.1 hypothetical protein [Kribbella sandramycini]NOL42791.1 hypothetical protein [Kribbella sandramycini]